MTITRATLPQEFYDITSAKLLIQPEPQYLHAQLIKMGLNSALETDSAMGISPSREIAGDGAPYSDAESDRLELSDPIMSEAVHAVAELGQGPGHTIRMNRPQFANTTYTLASREVPAASTISTTPVDVSSEQVSITLKRFSGPYDQTNTRVAPHAVDALDASVSLHKLAEIVGKHLKRDYDRWLDSVGVALWDAVPSTNIIRPTGFSADNDSTLAGDAPMDFNTLIRAETQLDATNIPVFADGKRIAVLTPRQLQQLKDDAQYARYVEFHKDFNPMFKSYIGTCGNIHILKSNTLTTSLNSSSVSINYGQMFGPGMVGVGYGKLPHTAYSTADNYGEQALVIWLTYAGFTTLDSRFGCSLRTS